METQLHFAAPVEINNVVKTDGHSVPSLDKNWDIGSADLRFNDIYAETFQGTAVLASNLDISGTQGDVLIFNGSTWTSGARRAAAISVGRECSKHFGWQ